MRVRRIAVAVALAAAPSVAATAQQPVGQAVQAGAMLVDRDATGVGFRIPEGILRITVWGDRIVRVTVSRAGAAGPSPERDLATVGSPRTVAWTIAEEPGRWPIVAPAMRIVVDRETGAVALLGADGEPRSPRLIPAPAGWAVHPTRRGGAAAVRHRRWQRDL